MLKREILEGVEYWLENFPEKVGQALSVYKKDCTISQICPRKKEPLILSIKPYFQQNWDGKKDKMEESIICSFMWQRILRGDINYSIQETPQCYSDNEVEANDQLVKSYINCVRGNKIIDACFIGGTQGADGHIQFKKPPMKRSTCFPLEIGYCHATQFYYNIMVNGSIARLPYGMDYIVYFENTKSMSLEMGL